MQWWIQGEAEEVECCYNPSLLWYQGWEIYNGTVKSSVDFDEGYDKIRELIRGTDVLIIDEISMLR